MSRHQKRDRDTRSLERVPCPGVPVGRVAESRQLPALWTGPMYERVTPQVFKNCHRGPVEVAAARTHGPAPDQTYPKP